MADSRKLGNPKQVLRKASEVTQRGLQKAREAREEAKQAPTPLGPGSLSSTSLPTATVADENDGTSSIEETVSAPAPVSPPIADRVPSWLLRTGLGSWLLLGLLVIVALVVYLTSQVLPVFIGVFLALVFTSILHPLVNLFARVMPRFPATFLALLSAVAVISAMVSYVVASVTSQWDSLQSQFSSGVQTMIDSLENSSLPFHITQQELSAQLSSVLTGMQDYVQENAPSLAGEVVSNAGTVVEVFTVLALALFVTIFFLASGENMWRWFLNELPAKHRENVHRAAGAGWYSFSGYARGTVLVAFTDALMAGIFLQLIGVPLAAPLAVLVFIGAFIPIIGAPLAMLVAMMVALASGGLVQMIVVCLGVAGIGQIEGHILQPLIMGRQVSLHPVVVLIGVAVGTFSAGLLGAIVAVPLIGVCWSVYSELHVKDAPVRGELPRYGATPDAQPGSTPPASK